MSVFDLCSVGCLLVFLCYVSLPRFGVGVSRGCCSLRLRRETSATIASADNPREFPATGTRLGLTPSCGMRETSAAVVYSLRRAQESNSTTATHAGPRNLRAACSNNGSVISCGGRPSAPRATGNGKSDSCCACDETLRRALRRGAILRKPNSSPVGANQTPDCEPSFSQTGLRNRCGSATGSSRFYWRGHFDDDANYNKQGKCCVLSG